MAMEFAHRDAMLACVRETVYNTPVLDLHTHLYDPGLGDLLLRGVDELLTYHYLVAELFRAHPMADGAALTPDAFYAMPKSRQAEWVWDHIFLRNSPVGEAARGVVTALARMGLDANARTLEGHRAFFAGLPVHEHIDRVFAAAGVTDVVMTNDPFDDAERPGWEAGYPDNPERRADFHAAFRMDPLMVKPETGAFARLRGWGFNVADDLSGDSLAEVKRFLATWTDKMRPLYCACSLDAGYDLFANEVGPRTLREAVLPFCRERGLPFALMMGVRRQQNPALRLAGDSVGAVKVVDIARMLREFPDNRFLVTLLERGNQHEMLIVARKFANCLPFGCWWFLNAPETITEMTAMRMEWLGFSHVPQHSDARVLDQIAYKWTHSRALIGNVLVAKYADLWDAGWRATAAEIHRDTLDLFQNNFRRFVGMPTV